MNEQEKTVLGLGLYTGMADGESQQAEVDFVKGVARDCLGGANLTENEFLSIIMDFIEAHGKAAEAGTVGSLVIEEAEKLDDEKWRLLALKFCLMVAQADDDERFEEVEGHTIGLMMGAWKRDGSWDYSAEEAFSLAMALDIDSVLQDEDDAQAEDEDGQTEEIKNGLFIEHATGNLLTDLFGTENLISQVEEFKTVLNQRNQVPFVHFDGENDLENELYVFRSNGQKSTFKQIYDEFDYKLNRGPIFYLSKCVINYSFKTFIIFVQDGLVLEDPNNEGAVALYPWDSWGEVLFVKHRDLDAPVILLAHPTENNAPELSISPELSLQQVQFQEGGGQPSYTEQDLAFVTFGYSVLERYWETVNANREEPTNEIPLELFYILNTKGKDSGDVQTEDGQTTDTITETTETAPKDENTPVTAEPDEEVTVTLSKNHKTFKTESGDYRLERHKDGKIKAFKDDELCKNTKNVLRAINKEYKLGFTSGNFKKLHTRKLGKEIIEKMKTIQ